MSEVVKLASIRRRVRLHGQFIEACIEAFAGRPLAAYASHDSFMIIAQIVCNFTFTTRVWIMKT